jgi:hypothetical protein
MGQELTNSRERIGSRRVKWQLRCRKIAYTVVEKIVNDIETTGECTKKTFIT